MQCTSSCLDPRCRPPARIWPALECTPAPPTARIPWVHRGTCQICYLLTMMRWTESRRTYVPADSARRCLLSQQHCAARSAESSLGVVSTRDREGSCSSLRSPRPHQPAIMTQRDPHSTEQGSAGRKPQLSRRAIEAKKKENPTAEAIFTKIFGDQVPFESHILLPILTLFMIVCS